MKVAFLGTGVMGAPMARNVAGAGHEVTAWNRTASKAEALGLPTADFPAAAADGAEAVVTMLADGAAVEAVAREALPALPDGAVWIQMSTIGAPDAERLAALAADHDVTFVDAPVLGSRQPAEEGALVVLASGPEDARERCAPIFDALGSRTTWVGAAGAGTRLKIVVNAWLMSTTAALAETVALAEALDVRPEDFLDVTGNGDVGALYVKLNTPSMAAREFPRNFPLALAAKDTRLALEAAGATRLAVFEATLRQYERGVELGHGDDDWAAVIRAAEASPPV